MASSVHHTSGTYAVRRDGAARSLAFALAIALAVAGPAAAQDAGGATWEIDVHGGVMAPHQPSAGTGALPPALPPLSGLSGPTRPVSSWFFGDGAVLLNQALASVRLQPPIVSADPLAQSAFAERGTGAAIGARIARTLSRRLGVELSVDYAPSTWTVGSRARAAIEATRASFESAWQSLFSRPGLAAAREVAATAAIEERRSADLTVTGAATIALGSIGRVRPYVAAGAGVVSHRGALPSVVFDGRYDIVFGLPIPNPPLTGIAEHDTVTMRATLGERQIIAVVGGGLRHDLSTRIALRIDVREHIGRNMLRTQVDASPSVEPRASGASILTIGTTPPLVFSTIAGRSTLSGPPLAGFTTFEGHGMSAALHLTAGLAWRF